jgi:hypothetical protein
MDVIETYVFTVTSTNGFYSSLPPLLSKSGLKLVCNVNIVYGNLKSENSQDYAQTPQPNYTFMNMASGSSATILSVEMDGCESVPCVVHLGTHATGRVNVQSNTQTSALACEVG